MTVWQTWVKIVGLDHFLDMEVIVSYQNMSSYWEYKWNKIKISGYYITF